MKERITASEYSTQYLSKVRLESKAEEILAKYRGGAHLESPASLHIDSFAKFHLDAANNARKWKTVEEKWLKLFRNKTVETGMSATQEVTHEDEWLVEVYMETDFRSSRLITSKQR
ncbi:hypothetical protein NXS08_00650 [Gleimia sp. 6138-11-ORH1]|uniref:hypothetical protein n=1 Tax=Gleimia sp. 6138-11-ORH1 TaxID=2973937 RepID=UPI00216A0FF5|nr:hypothetical protein [Gleimia sp. 6138-11-ORH1]MCS4484001.1 hypothetical protein [Gleimia sp. 6138-11-ORH1]